MKDRKPIPDEPSTAFWLGVIIVVLAIAVGAAQFVRPAHAGDAPLPTPKPAKAECVSIVGTYQVVGVIESRAYGNVTYLAGDELAAYLTIFNAIPPASGYVADAAIVISPSRPLNLSPGQVTNPGTHNIRFFNHGCLVAQSTFADKIWSRLSAAVEKARGVPA